MIVPERDPHLLRGGGHEVGVLAVGERDGADGLHLRWHARNSGLLLQQRGERHYYLHMPPARLNKVDRQRIHDAGTDATVRYNSTRGKLKWCGASPSLQKFVSKVVPDLSLRRIF